VHASGRGPALESRPRPPSLPFEKAVITITRTKRPREVSAACGRIGGLTTAAMTIDSRQLTEAARQARYQKYLDQVPAEITDPDERTRRADLLRRADMIRMSQKAAKARKLKAEAARLEAEAAEVADDSVPAA